MKQITKNMSKISLVSKRETSFKGQDGQDISGFFYVGFLESEKAIEFFSTQDHEITEGGISYDKNSALELNLRTKIRKDGRVGYSEITN